MKRKKGKMPPSRSKKKKQSDKKREHSYQDIMAALKESSTDSSEALNKRMEKKEKSLMPKTANKKKVLVKHSSSSSSSSSSDRSKKKNVLFRKGSTESSTDSTSSSDPGNDKMEFFKYSDKKNVLTKTAAKIDVDDENILYKSKSGTLKIAIHKISKFIIGKDSDIPKMLIDKEARLLLSIITAKKKYIFLQKDKKSSSIYTLMKQISDVLDERILSIQPNEIKEAMKKDECVQVDLVQNTNIEDDVFYIYSAKEKKLLRPPSRLRAMSQYIIYECGASDEETVMILMDELIKLSIGLHPRLPEIVRKRKPHLILTISRRVKSGTFREHVFVQCSASNESIQEFICEVAESLNTKKKMFNINIDVMKEQMEEMKNNGSGLIEMKVISRGILSKLQRKLSGIRGSIFRSSKQSSQAAVPVEAMDTIHEEEKNDEDEIMDNKSVHSEINNGQSEKENEISIKSESEDEDESEKENQTEESDELVITQRRSTKAKISEYERMTSSNIAKKSITQSKKWNKERLVNQKVDIPIISWEEARHIRQKSMDALKMKLEMSDLQNLYDRATSKIGKLNEKCFRLKNKNGDGKQKKLLELEEESNKRIKVIEPKKSERVFDKDSLRKSRAKITSSQQQNDEIESDRELAKNANSELEIYKKAWSEMEAMFGAVHKELNDLNHAQYHSGQPSMQNDADSELSSLTSHYTLPDMDGMDGQTAMNEKLRTIKSKPRRVTSILKEENDQKEREYDEPFEVTKKYQKQIKQMQNEIENLHKRAQKRNRSSKKSKISDLVRIIGKDQKFTNVKIFADDNIIQVASDIFVYDQVWQLIRCTDNERKWVFMTNKFQIQVLASSARKREECLLFIDERLRKY